MGTKWEKLFRELSENDRPSDWEACVHAPASGEASAAVAAPVVIPPALSIALEEIWTNILLNSGKKPGTLFIGGARGGEGATFISRYLSLFLARESSLRVLYIDADPLNRASLFRISEHADKRGLSAFLLEDESLSYLAIETEVERLHMLPPGDRDAGRLAEILLSRPELQEEFLSFCESNYDLAIFDSLPLLSTPIMAGVARLAEAVVLVCRAAHTKRETIHSVIGRLEKSGARITGMVLNGRTFPVPVHIPNFLKSGEPRV